MKIIDKVIAILLVLLLLMGVFGCSNTSEYIALEVGGSDSADGGKHLNEYSIWSNAMRSYHQDETAPAEAAITIDGVTYTGTYLRSYVWQYNLYVTHLYDSETVRFGINASTGELSEIYFKDNCDDAFTLSGAEGRKLIDAIAENYIDVADYTALVSVGETAMSVNYIREVAGYETNDRIKIAIDAKGNLSAIYMEMVGSFDGVKVDALSETKSESAIDVKLKSIYEGVQGWDGYEIQDVILVTLEDGSVAELYKVETSVVTKYDDGTQDEEGSIVTILVQSKNN